MDRDQDVQTQILKPFSQRISTSLEKMIPDILISNRVRLNNIYDELLRQQIADPKNACTLPLMHQALLNFIGFEIDRTGKIIDFPKSKG